MTNVKKCLDQMDWHLLRDQKAALWLTAFDLELDPELKDALDGILNLIDALQDAAEKDGYPVQWIEDEGED